MERPRVEEIIWESRELIERSRALLRATVPFPDYPVGPTIRLGPRMTPSASTLKARSLLASLGHPGPS